VVRVPNRGAYVRELTPEEVIEIYEVREILEVAAALRTPLPAPKEVIKVLKKIQDEHSEAIAKHELRKVFRLNIQFHHQQFLAGQNTKLVQSIMEYARQAHLIRAIKYSEPGYLQKVERDHRKLSVTTSPTLEMHTFEPMQCDMELAFQHFGIKRPISNLPT
jgi:DNA-binding GntR family transcriptional regulator